MSLIFSVTSCQVFCGFGEVTSLGLATKSQPHWPGTSVASTCLTVSSWCAPERYWVFNHKGYSRGMGTRLSVPRLLSEKSCLGHLVWGHGMVVGALMLEGIAFFGGFGECGTGS